MVLLAGAVVACGPGSPADLYGSAKELHAKGDRAAAIVQYKAALTADAKLHGARVGLAQLLVASGEFEAAMVELDRVVAEAPATPGAVDALAQLLGTSADPKRALHRLSALKPQAASDQATVQAHIASVWGVLGDEAKADDALRKSLALDPANRWANLFMAKRLFAQSRIADAEAKVDEVLKRDAAFTEALYLKANLRLAAGDAKAAEELWRRCISTTPSFVAAYEALLTRSLVRKDLPGAKKLLEELRSNVGWHPTVSYLDARILIEEGQLPAARERLLKLLAVAPDHVGLLTLTGVVEAKVGSPVQAASQLRKALSIRPDLDGARGELAEIELRLGQAASALETLNPLLQSPRPSKRHLVMASDALLRMGRAQEADAVLKKAADAAPDDAQLQAAQLLRRLQRGDAQGSLGALEGLAERTNETYADEALIFARLARREFEPALQALDALEKKAPGRATSAELRGRILFAQRRLPDARAAFEQAVQRDPKRFSAIQAVTLIDQLENKPEAAIKRLEAVVAEDPKNALALVTLAEYLSRSGAPQERVIEMLGKATTVEPTWADPRRRLIEHAIKRRQFKQALEYSRAALAALPDDESVLEVAGRAQLLSGDVEQAVKTIRRRADLMPDSAAPQLELAKAYATQGRRDAAEVALKRAIELEPFSPRAQHAYLEHMLTAQRTSEALAHIQRYRSLRPRDPMSYSLLAAYQMRMRQDADAASTLRDGVAATDHPELALRLHSLYMKMNRDADADALERTWLGRHPEDANFTYQVAMRAVSKSQFPAAERALRKVVQARPSHTDALNNLAYVIVENGGRDAVEFARRAMTLAPEDTAVMDTLARALSSEGRHAEALTLQRRAVEIDPESDLLRLGLARVALGSGDKTLAKSELDRILGKGKSSPAHEEAKKLVAKL